MKDALHQFSAALITANEVGLPKVDNGNLIQNVLMPVYYWAGALAVVVIIIAGFIFVTSNGQPQQITRAKQAILGAVVGLIVIFIAFIITSFVIANA